LAKYRSLCLDGSAWIAAQVLLRVCDSSALNKIDEEHNENVPEPLPAPDDAVPFLSYALNQYPYISAKKIIPLITAQWQWVNVGHIPMTDLYSDDPSEL